MQIGLRRLWSIVATETATWRDPESSAEIDFEMLEFPRVGCYLSIEIVFEKSGDAEELRLSWQAR
ncbi:hypothetical protein [Paraburkholderia terrae]|uniref:hypothetical protein n=1 Tax=Paraburkholderia terrae TaxID=311230 RepID=UPI003365787A